MPWVFNDSKGNIKESTVTTSGAQVLLDEEFGTGASGTITFANIPSGYRHLRVEWSGSSTAAAGAVLFSFKANNVAGGTDYLSNFSDGSVSYFSAAIAGYCSGTTGGVSGNGRVSGGVVDLQYAGTSLIKSYTAQFASKINTTGTASSDLKFAQGGGAYFINTANAPVSRLDFILSSGNWTTDTKFSLYGIV